MKRLLLGWLFVVVVSALVLGAVSSKPASAATTTVNCTADASALASALATANDGDTLAIQGTCKGNFEISHSLTLAGSGGATLDGQAAGTVLTVDSGTTVVLTDLTISNGFAFVGGGVVNQGALTLTDSTVSGNSNSFAGAGGGIVNGANGSLVLNNSTVSGNSSNLGGGIYNFGPLTLNNSSVSDNSGNPGGIMNNASGAVTLANSQLSDNAGSGLRNVFEGTVTLDSSSVSGNSGPFSGINNSGTLTVANSTVSGNSSSFAPGGGIANGGGTLVVRDSTVRGNSSANNSGGGISNTGNGNATVTGSTISGNSAATGGGVDNEPSSVLTLSNDTITGNTASDSGGGVYATGFSTLSLSYDTIAGNSASNSGGGIFISGFTATVVESTIIAGQTAGGNCVGSIGDGGYNLDDGTSCGFSAANNSLSNSNPLLDPSGLGDNGGPTQTIALEAGSPALDAIPSGVNGCGAAIAIDQRGVTRPQGSGCEIGAFEHAVPVGSHDSASGLAKLGSCEASGWAQDPDAATTHLSVRVLVDGVVVATTVADLFRQDLLDAGIGDGTFAFDVDLTSLLTHDTQHQVRAQAQDPLTGQWVDLPGTPVSLTCTQLAGSHDGNSGVQKKSSCIASGWAWDADTPKTRLQVRVKVDGKVVAETTADQFRPDVRDAGFGDGYSGWTINLFGLVTPRVPHLITVEERDSTLKRVWLPLDNTNVSLTCTPT